VVRLRRGSGGLANLKLLGVGTGHLRSAASQGGKEGKGSTILNGVFGGDVEAYH